ncbi:MAG: aspartate kinase [Bacteroidaceae bacterium]|nr:aspartate kinase [Bacteroidaceae bacterium]
MKVLKFGGTSVGSPERMKAVARLISDGQRKIVVLSAMSGTTNSLVEIADYAKKRNTESAGAMVGHLRSAYKKHLPALYATDAAKKACENFFREEFISLQRLVSGDYDEATEKTILAQGEILSTHMLTFYLQELGVKVRLMPALDYMRTDADGEPMLSPIHEYWTRLLAEDTETEVFLTQGFICRNAQGEIDNLQRGGSDYTASLIGAAMHLEEIQIWTDIDGMHNNDPRFVEGTRPVRQLHFEEAAELAYFGAKILHPTCIQPARYAGVPVRLLNNMEPEAHGTLINNTMQPGVIKAVAAKDNITAIKVVSSRMLLATGFLRHIFDIFARYKTSIDMVATSEVGVSLSIDNASRLTPIVEELKKVGTVEVDQDMCIICVVGDLVRENKGFIGRITSAFADVAIRMVSYGGSNHNVSFLVRQDDKQKALQALSDALFNDNHS